MRLRRHLLLLPLLVALVAAGPPADTSPETLVRQGNAAVGRGEFDAAERHYADAEDTARDPGLVAFNKANALFHQNRHADAERHYTRSLDDADAPPARRAAALYNRGVCQLQQGGIDKLRGAIDSFSRCLAAKPDDANLTADARHNLEVAKLLWVASRAKEQKKPLPNEQPHEPPPEPKKERPEQKTPYDPFSEENQADGGTKTNSKPQELKGGAKGTPRATDETMPGRGAAPVLKSADQLPELSDDQMRQYLELLAVRVAKERRDTAALTAPPERPAVKDW